MSNKHITSILHSGKAGNIESTLKSYAIMDFTNDGARYYSMKEQIPITSLPLNSDDELEIYLTSNDFHVIQFHDSYLTFNLRVTMNFSHDLISAADFAKLTPAQQEMMKHQFMFLGLKSGSNLIREYTIVHRGKTISSTMQNQGTLESFFYNVYKPRSEKNNRRFIHSLYHSVHNYDTSACGTYVPITDIRANVPLTFDIPVSVPFDDILIFSGFKDYPCFFGDMILRFRINPNALVYCRVDPRKSTARSFNEIVKNISDSVEQERFKRMMLNINDVLKKPNIDVHYTKQFIQIGCRSSQFGWKLNADPASGAMDVDLGVISSFDNFIPTVSTMQIQRCTATLAGYRASDKCVTALKEYFTTHPFVIPSQRVEIKSMGGAPTASGFQNCQNNLPINMTSDLMLLFPTDSRQCTCFMNPMYQDLQLSVGNRKFPEKPISTCNDPNFFQMMVNASDLDSLFEACDEYEDSLTRPLANTKHILTPDTDLTSFCVTFQCERSGGTSIMFDGLDFGNQNASIDLRGTPMFRDELDLYYRPRLHAADTLGGINTQCPLLGLLKTTFWIFTYEDGGTCNYLKDYTAEDVLRKNGYIKEGETE